MREIDYRVDILRSGVRFGHLRFDANSPPTVYCDADAEIKLSLRGSFLPSSDFDDLTDELQPVCIVDGEEHPLGVYRVTTRRDETNETGTRCDLEAYDRAVVLRQCKLEQRDSWPAGTAYGDVLLHYLQAAGITRVLRANSGKALQTAREDWDIGTSFLTVINTLLAEINYREIWFDLDGVAHLEPYEAPSAGRIAHHYGLHGRAAKLLTPGISVERDVFDKPNVIICVLSNPELPPETATAVNDFPVSRLSILRRGLRIPQVVKVANVASGELQAYANRLRDEAMQTGEYVAIGSPVYPDHGVADTVALEMPELHGLFRETRWEISMQAGARMRHTLERMVIV